MPCPDCRAANTHSPLGSESKQPSSHRQGWEGIAARDHSSQLNGPYQPTYNNYYFSLCPKHCPSQKSLLSGRLRRAFRRIFAGSRNKPAFAEPEEPQCRSSSRLTPTATYSPSLSPLLGPPFVGSGPRTSAPLATATCSGRTSYVYQRGGSSDHHFRDRIEQGGNGLLHVAAAGMMRDASAAARTCLPEDHARAEVRLLRCHSSPSRLELRAEYFRTMEQQDPEYGAESDLNGTSTANEELDGVVVGSVSASEA